MIYLVTKLISKIVVVYILKNTLTKIYERTMQTEEDVGVNASQAFI